MTDRQDVFDLAAAYARCVDRRDYPALAALFGPAGTLVVRDTADLSAPPVRAITGGDEIAARIARLHTRFIATFHLIGQQWAQVDGDRATAETYCVAHHLFEHEARRFDRVMHIRYDDTVVRDRAAWRFDERRLAIDWVDVRPVGDSPLPG